MAVDEVVADKLLDEVVDVIVFIPQYLRFPPCIGHIRPGEIRARLLAGSDEFVPRSGLFAI